MKIKNIFLKIFITLIFALPAISIYGAGNEEDFIVVIDAGHGGHDTGAIDNGVKEKDINLAVAQLLRDDIKKRNKNIKVIMTRSDDTFVTLQGRADIANKNKADLFISIHTNSVDKENKNRSTVSGTSVYALGLHKDKENLNVAKRENSVIKLENNQQKYSGFDPSKDESYIIFEMAQKKNLVQSLRFADLAQKQLVGVAERKDRGVKQAGFWVLHATSMPAVLVELDFICNPASAEYMSSKAGEKKLAEALCNAVEKYYNLVKSGKRTALNSRYTSSRNNESRNNESRNNQKNIATSKSTEKKNADAKPVNSEPKSNSTGTSGALVSLEKSKRNDAPPVTSNSRKVTTARKRRSASSRQFSDNRNFETSSIEVKSENDYLAKAEIKKTDSKVEKAPVVKETPKEKKKRLALEKKKKEKERKEKEALKKKEAKEREEARKKEAERRKKYQQNSNSNRKTNNNSTKRVVVTKGKSVENTTENNSNKENSVSTGQFKGRKSLQSKKNRD